MTMTNDFGGSGVKVTGKITKLNLGCAVDGPTCSIFVDDIHEIIFAYGYVIDANGKQVERGEMGQMMIDNIIVNWRNFIGKKIEAFVAIEYLMPKADAMPTNGKPLPPMRAAHNIYTLAGSKDYYIKLLD
jgi:hypothetical protein